MPSTDNGLIAIPHRKASHTNVQFANSPDLENELNEAIIESLDAYNDLSSTTFNNKSILRSSLSLLLGPRGLNEKLKKMSA